jgi:glycosyltransferase involved in cell wall biosynthesis
MSASAPSPDRVTVDGKFFRLGKDKFHLKGITYGPFAPNADGEMFANPDQTVRDFKQIQELGANTLRLYYVPPKWFLDLAAAHGLKLLIDIPWPKHLCFFESYEVQEEAGETVRKAITQCQGHPAVFAYSVVNEIPAEIVRWSGVTRVERFIDHLIEEAKRVDPACLCTFASFPPTEFLRPRNTDFLCFNVYLHQPRSFDLYLARLQTLADTKPLVLGEFGLDSVREGESQKCTLLQTQIEIAFRSGLAGTVIYSYTDDWFRGGKQVEDWAFGLTTRDRQPKKSFYQVQQLYAAAPFFPLPRIPKVSVVVASYNGARTLDLCLASLAHLNYPEYEVILVDDGSTDNTQEIARRYPDVRIIHQSNQGLSTARNAGIAASKGEIVAFTDSDCRADEDWLYYLVNDLLRCDFTGIGGHNFLPPDDSPSAAAVLASPGGPAHVMVTDQRAEHIPGCNMGFYKWALDEIHGFDPVFRKAGDDVDICWRLQERGFNIGFSPAGFVWHYRRSTVKAYLKQQAGYGEAEALLTQKHPEYFNLLGGGLWRGRIYTASKFGLVLNRSVIYHGVFGSGFFQKLYAPGPAFAVMLCTSLEYQAFVNLPLALLSISFPLVLPLAVVSLVLTFGICSIAAVQADLPKDKTRSWSRPLVALLFFLQPIVRGWARHKTRLNLSSRRKLDFPAPETPFANAFEPPSQIAFWSKNGVDRFAFLDRIVSKLKAAHWDATLDSGWLAHDLELAASRWTQSTLTTVNEYLAGNKIFLRCRLLAKWSGLAKILFAMGGVAIAFLLFQFAHLQPWLWMLPSLLPIFIWFLEDERRHQKGLLIAMIEETARDLKLEKYHD